MREKLFSGSTLVLSILGLGINVFFVWMTKLFHIPLYLDSVGTILTAALGGALPGIAVGFFSNCITAFTAVTPDPMTLYYGFLSVLIAAAAAWISYKGLFLKWYGRLGAVFTFAAIGGALGSVVTWALYGFSFGQGITAPLAQILYGNFPAGRFASQFAADLLTDLGDKLLTVFLVCLILYLLPEAVLCRLPLGHIYQRQKKELSIQQLHQKIHYRKRSIANKIIALILASSFLLGIAALLIGTATYQKKLVAQYAKICGYAVELMLTKIDGDQMDSFLTEGETAEGYRETRQDLYDILNSAQDITYMYVYQIREDGCHVVFDLDTAELQGEPAGTRVDFDTTFPYKKEVLAGEEIPYMITKDTYGWLLTVYRPVKDSKGMVTAYAAADISMEDIRTNIYTFLINIASLLFGVMILIAMITIWYCDRRVLEPINVLAEQAHEFDFDGTRKGHRVRDRDSVETGDELEEVFQAMCRTEDAIADHMEELKAKNSEISKMQRNIIYTLANMVENRDGNTGGHIRRTAQYVGLIGKKLLEQGIYPEQVNEEYCRKLSDSAPLHDIGKIKIPDAILNKPGRLTAEEFEIIKTHTTEGRNILRTSLSEIEDGSWLSMAMDMAMYHHEKWDGSGYPKGLSGEGIPLCARIMAVSDVFDALVSERSYKKAFSYEKALEIIREGSGSHFDPVLVTAFDDLGDEVKNIMEKEQSCDGFRRSAIQSAVR